MLLSTTDLVVNNEFVLLGAVAKWVNTNEKNRNKHIRELCQKLNYDQLNSEFLNESNVGNSSLVPSDANEQLIAELKDGLAEYARNPASVNRNYWGGIYSVVKDGVYVSRGYKQPKKLRDYSFPVLCRLTRWKDKIYITGGWRRGSAGPASEAYSFDLISKAITRIASMTVPRHSHAIASNKGKIYIFGGYTRDSFTNACEVYDPILNTWTSLPNMEITPSVCCAVNFNGDILVYRASWLHPFKKFFQVFNPSTNEWKPAYEIKKHGIDSVKYLYYPDESSTVGTSSVLCYTKEGKYFLYNPLTNHVGELVDGPISFNRDNAICDVTIDDKNILILKLETNCIKMVKLNLFEEEMILSRREDSNDKVISYQVLTKGGNVLAL